MTTDIDKLPQLRTRPLLALLTFPFTPVILKYTVCAVTEFVTTVAAGIFGLGVIIFTAGWVIEDIFYTYNWVRDILN